MKKNTPPPPPRLIKRLFKEIYFKGNMGSIIKEK